MLLFPTGVSGATDSSSMLLAISARISSVIDSARDRGREPSDGARDAGRDPERPQYCDACFTGDYPTSLTDMARREDKQHKLAFPSEQVA